MSTPLAGKNVVVTGEPRHLGDQIELISMNLRGVQITGIPIHSLNVSNAGDVVLAPDSFNGGLIQGLDEVSLHIRNKVSDHIPVVVMLLNSTAKIVQGDKPGIIGVKGVSSLPEAVRLALGL